MKYRLFGLLYSLKNVEYASKFRFTRVTPEYILLYTDKSRLKPPTGRAVELKEKDLWNLTDMEEAWLFDCGITLLAERMKNDTDGLKNLSDMVDRLEAELEEVSKHEPE